MPVGPDQEQHLELANDYAERFNAVFGSEAFSLPKVRRTGKDQPRIMSLKDGKVKMSKSDASEASRINLSDGPLEIRDKIRKAKTDCVASVSDLTSKIKADAKNRPEMTNLVNIYALATGQATGQTEQQFEGKGVAEFKRELAEALVAL